MLDPIQLPAAVIIVALVIVTLLLFAAFNYGRAYQLNKKSSRRRLELTEDQISRLQTAADKYDEHIKAIERDAKDAAHAAKAQLTTEIHGIVGAEARLADNWSLLRKSHIVYGFEIEED